MRALRGGTASLPCQAKSDEAERRSALGPVKHLRCRSSVRACSPSTSRITHACAWSQTLCITRSYFARRDEMARISSQLDNGCTCTPSLNAEVSLCIQEGTFKPAKRAALGGKHDKLTVAARFERHQQRPPLGHANRRAKTPPHRDLTVSAMKQAVTVQVHAKSQSGPDACMIAC